jgi:hypothetical protein
VHIKAPSVEHGPAADATTSFAFKHCIPGATACATAGVPSALHNLNTVLLWQMRVPGGQAPDGEDGEGGLVVVTGAATDWTVVGLFMGLMVTKIPAELEVGVTTTAALLVAAPEIDGAA